MYHTIAIRANYWVVREKRLALDGPGSTLAVLELFNSLSHTLSFLFAVLSVNGFHMCFFFCSIWNTFHTFCIYLWVASEGLITKRSPIISWKTLHLLSQKSSRIVVHPSSTWDGLLTPGATRGHDWPWCFLKRPIIYCQIQLDSQY